MATKGDQGTWRTARFFLEDEGVHEVSFDTLHRSSALRCTCGGFRPSGGGCHTAWVSSNMSAEIAATRSKTVPALDTWRKFVLFKYRVEVL